MSQASIANNIFRLCPGLSPDLVRSFIVDSYTQLAREDWFALNITRNFITYAPYSTGKINVDVNGNVTGIGTTFASWMVGGWMTLEWSDSKFEVLTYTSPTSITIGGWSQNALTNYPYTIFFYIYKLPLPQIKVYDVTYQTSLPKKSQSYINEIDPSRLETGQPLLWADAGLDIDGGTLASQIEVYPMPDQQYPLRVYGKILPSITSPTVPPVLYLPEDVVEAHALMQCLRAKCSIDPKGGWDVRLAEQMKWYAQIHDDARFEDFTRGSAPDAVKDTMAASFAYPQSDTFAASHDISS